jgi:hypothetical protein
VIIPKIKKHMGGDHHPINPKWHSIGSIRKFRGLSRSGTNVRNHLRNPNKQLGFAHVAPKNLWEKMHHSHIKRIFVEEK